MQVSERDRIENLVNTVALNLYLDIITGALAHAAYHTIDPGSLLFFARILASPDGVLDVSDVTAHGLPST